MEDILSILRSVLPTIWKFTQMGGGVKLRRYQAAVAEAIVQSVKGHLGDTIVVMFPRQSGKNELQAQIENYLMTIFSEDEAELVKVSPTWKPQTLNAMSRLRRVMRRNLIALKKHWCMESGYIFRLGNSRMVFLSGEPTTNVVGATASTLLECDEAQDILISKWDKDFSPMAASTNATRVFWGTAWTSKTLLAREKRAAQQAEKRDGRRRVFLLTADDVAAEVPAYGEFVAGQIAKLGRGHPLVKTQFFSEEIDAEGGMFPAGRQALMQGKHAHLESPEPGKVYALLLDVAGEDEGAAEEGNVDALANKKRDSTALTIVEVDLISLADELIKAPTYRVVSRHEWVGVKHTTLYGRIKALADHWQARYLVVDATGVGAGLASFLDKALPGQVIPYVFTSKSKSDLGWGFLAVIETGRFKDHATLTPGPSPYKGEGSNEQGTFWTQVQNCQSAVLDGPGKLLRWGVPDGFRNPETGELVHDDLLISAALCWVLDAQEWGLAISEIVQSEDLFRDMYEVF